MGDYGYSEKRKSKNDKRKKRLYGAYKRGGKFRASNVKEGNRKES